MAKSDTGYEECKRKADAWYASTTPAQQAHHFHLQRISFAAGNCAIDSDKPIEYWKALVTQAAGACPCGEC